MSPEQHIEVSQRLWYLAQMMPMVEQAADIGTDHAQLLIYLVQKRKIYQGIGVEIVEGPYQNALKNIKTFGLDEKIKIRRGDGLEPIRPGEVDVVVIAGMGGKTIQGIIERSPDVINSLKWLLLQPMSQAGALRQYLQSIGWRIFQETLVEDRDIIYPIILAESSPMGSLTDWEAEYGPIILNEKPALLRKLVQRDILARQHILEQISRSNQSESRLRQQQIEKEYAQLEELLKCL